MPSRSLDDLSPRIRPRADQLLANADDAGIPLTVTYTLRTQAEQDLAIAEHRSQVAHSMHEPQPPDNLSLAFDVCPSVLLTEPNYCPTSSLWWEIGEMGKALGLRWGGQFSRPEPPPVGQPPKDHFFDPGHFEFIP